MNSWALPFLWLSASQESKGLTVLLRYLIPTQSAPKILQKTEILLEYLSLIVLSKEQQSYLKSIKNHIQELHQVIHWILISNALMKIYSQQNKIQHTVHISLGQEIKRVGWRWAQHFMTVLLSKKSELQKRRKKNNKRNIDLISCLIRDSFVTRRIVTNCNLLIACWESE